MHYNYILQVTLYVLDVHYMTLYIIMHCIIFFLLLLYCSVILDVTLSRGAQLFLFVLFLIGVCC